MRFDAEPPDAGGIQMKSRSIAALCLVAVLAAVVAASTPGATKKATANSITVWLQVDAQSG